VLLLLRLLVDFTLPGTLAFQDLLGKALGLMPGGRRARVAYLRMSMP